MARTIDHLDDLICCAAFPLVNLRSSLMQLECVWEFVYVQLVE